ncbi:MAG: MATE family efflux transporter [Firmicutes bacterium]|nr:MATE family efflux transporter [Bacillota bacterium]
MEDKYRSDLTQGNVSIKLLKFTIPFLIAQVLQALYGIVDMFIVGQFMGNYGITAVNTSSNVSNFITLLVSGFAMSGTVLVAQYIGAKEEENAKKTIGTVFTIFLIFSIIFTVVGLLITPHLLALLKTPAEAYKEACNYLYICFTGTIFICGYNSVSAILRGLGDSKRPLRFVAVAAVTNVILDIIFVGPLGMGAGGAALATIMAQALSFILAVITLYRQNFIFDFKPKSFVIDKSKLPLIFKIGLPSAVQSTVVNVSIFFVISRINAYGLAASTAAGICSKIDSFALLPAVAISQAISSMAGQNLGARQIDRAKQTLFAGIRMSLVFAVCIFAIVRFKGETLIGIFGCDAETVEIGLQYIKHVSICYFGNAVVFMFSGFATGSGNSLFAMMNAIFNMVLARISLVFVFEDILGLGLAGIFMALGLSQFAGLIPSSIFYFSGVWKKDAIHKNTDKA